ncbi:MAG: hypothetical protein GPOALKHO_001363 [Sodalis sp.]|nr:MAG: hypothetical protein GPOALKHO_001363 [Sodalis sp.]
MLNFQHVDCISHDRQSVEIGIDNQVGDIVKQLAYLQSGQSFRRDAAVGTANPQKRGFAPATLLKEAWVLFMRKLGQSWLLLRMVEMSLIDVNCP